MKLDVVVAPPLINSTELSGCLCAVIDVLRCTTSIVTALVSGAVGVCPCLTIDEARSKANELGKDAVLLGGEERGEQIPGFDLGNSPFEYLDSKTVAGKLIYSYTSNGTGAIRRAFEASGKPVYIAALINISAVSSEIVKSAQAEKPEGIAVLCSGRYGNPSAEDTFCAGLLIERVINGLLEAGVQVEMTDSATISTGFAKSKQGMSAEVLAASDHGRFLQSIGFFDDLEFASHIDKYQVVPVFDGERVVLLS